MLCAGCLRCGGEFAEEAAVDGADFRRLRHFDGVRDGKAGLRGCMRFGSQYMAGRVDAEVLRRKVAEEG